MLTYGERKKQLFIISVGPDVFRNAGIVLFENFSAEQVDAISGPQNEENSAGDPCIGKGAAGKSQQKQQRCDHDHSGQGGENIQMGSGC